MAAPKKKAQANQLPNLPLLFEIAGRDRRTRAVKHWSVAAVLLATNHSQAEISRKCGISKSTIGKWTRNKAFQKLVAFCQHWWVKERALLELEALLDEERKGRGSPPGSSGRKRHENEAPIRVSALMQAADEQKANEA